MKFPSPEFEDAVAALCHGTIRDEDLVALHELLRTDTAAQDEYLWRVEVHGALAVRPQDVESPPVSEAPERKFPAVLLAAAALVLLALGLWQGIVHRPGNTSVVARIIQLENSQWMNPDASLQVGDVISKTKRIELQSGEAELLFDSGARMRLVGPVIVEARTANSARLVLGEVSLVAETPESKGFVLVTPTSKFVDIGTAFTASVAPDGLSRLEVSEGEVDVVFDAPADAPRLKAGETMYVEPGAQKIVARIEEGDGTPAFRFPTIVPPGDEDYADQVLGHAAIRVIDGQLRQRPGNSRSGPASVLIDGVGQSRQDAPRESAFFETGYEGYFLVDLGAPVSIREINTYSWHQHDRALEHRHRARQMFSLYGFSGEHPPAFEQPPLQAGWTRIARVNSDRFFRVTEALDRPAQQASSITAATGAIGTYRYLLWQVKSGTFFGEFDVYEQQ